MQACFCLKNEIEINLFIHSCSWWDWFVTLKTASDLGQLKVWVTMTHFEWARQVNREIAVRDQHPQFQMNVGNSKKKTNQQWLNETAVRMPETSRAPLCKNQICCIWIVCVCEFAYHLVTRTINRNYVENCKKKRNYFVECSRFLVVVRKWWKFTLQLKLKHHQTNGGVAHVEKVSRINGHKRA